MSQSRRLRRTVLCSGAALYVVLSATAVRAQSTPPTETASASTDANQVQEVVVTANKRQEKLHDVALSVTALGGEDLERRQELDISDIAKQVPGFSVQNAGDNLNRLIIRGENAGGTGATVGVVVDDVPFNFSSGNGNGSITTADLDPYDLKQVEVLRGPQGTLYGAGAEGGLVKYVTEPADPKRFAAGVETGFNSVDGGETAGNVKGYVNIPLLSNVAVRATGFYEGQPGYIRDPLAGDNFVNDGYKYGGRFSLFAQPLPDLTIKASAFIQKQKFDSTGSADVVGAFTTPTAPPSNQYELVSGAFTHRAILPELSDSNLHNYYVNVAYDLHLATVTSITSYGDQRFKSSSEIEGDPLAPGVTYADYLGAAVYGQPILATEGEIDGLKKYNEELRISSDPGLAVFGRPMEAQGGVFMTREVESLDQSFNVLSATAPYAALSPPLGNAAAPSRYDEVSVFGEVDYHFLPQFDISAGVRQSNITQRYHTVFTAGILVGPSATSPSSGSQETSTTFSVAPRWHVNDNTVIYGRVASGFRPGGPIGALPGEPAGYPTAYHSDSTLNYEAGVRTYLFDRKVTVDVAGFYIDWSHIQVLSQYQSPTGVSFFAAGNAGAAESHGIEWDLGWTPFHGLNLSAVGAWTDAELTKDAPGLGGLKGDTLAFVPDVSNTVNIDYERPLYQDYKGFIGLSWTFTGSEYTNFGVSPVLVNHALLPSYNTENLRLGVEEGRYTVEFFIRNLSDERAIVNYESAGALGGYGEGSFIQPRTFGMRFSAQY